MEIQDSAAGTSLRGKRKGDFNMATKSDNRDPKHVRIYRTIFTEIRDFYTNMCM